MGFTDQPFCIWAFAVDSKGAVRPAIKLATPINRAPVANISVIPHVQMRPAQRSFREDVAVSVVFADRALVGGSYRCRQ